MATTSNWYTTSVLKNGKTCFLLQVSKRIIDMSTEQLSKLGGVLSPTSKQIQIHIWRQYLFLSVPKETFGDENWRKGKNTTIDNLYGQNKDAPACTFWKKIISFTAHLFWNSEQRESELTLLGLLRDF